MTRPEPYPPQRYPGIEFTPPPGTIEDGQTEGEAMVEWKKVGDRYTIVRFDDEPLGESEAPEQEENLTMDEEIDRYAE
jgi:hypothetical protein